MSRSVARKSLRAREHHQPLYVPTGDNLKILAREYGFTTDLVSKYVFLLRKLTEIINVQSLLFSKLLRLIATSSFLLAFFLERGLDVLTQAPIKFVL